MAVRKKPKKVARKTPAITESQFAVVLEDLRSQFAVFGEALQGLGEKVDTGFQEIRAEIGAVKSDLGLVKSDLELVKSDLELVKSDLGLVKSELELVKDAVRTHTKELNRIDAKLDDDEARITKLEGAAE